MTSNLPSPAAENEPASSAAWRGWLEATTLKVTLTFIVVIGLLLTFLELPNALRWPCRVLWLASLAWLVVVMVRGLLAVRLTMKKALFLAVLGGFYWLVIALSCHVFVKLMSARDDRLTFRGITRLAPGCREGIQGLLDHNKSNQFDKEIGWVPRPGAKTAEYTVNAQGVRATREYALEVQDAGRRILCLGDSFTFGTAVGDAESYPAHGEALRPGTEWINLGIPGTCLVQWFRRYERDAPRFGGRHVVVGFMTNDALRTVNAFRPFVNEDSGSPYTKPFAKYVAGKFSIEPNAYDSLDDYRFLLANEAAELRRLQKLDYLTWSGLGSESGAIARTLQYVWESRGADRNLAALLNNHPHASQLIDSLLPVDPYGRSLWQPESPGFKAITAMFEHFHQRILTDGRKPLFLIIPGPLDVENFSERRPCQYSELLSHLKTKGLPVLDFLPVLIAKHKSDLSSKAIFSRNHYNSTVNRELAAEIASALKLP